MNTLLKISFLLCFSTTMAFAQPEYGIATRYSDQLQGTRTHSGASYDKDELTAAHKTLPFGTMVKVTRTDLSKSVIVRINDRGPFVKGHVVDISGRAAQQISLGVGEEAKVKVEVIKANTKPEPEPVTEADRPLPIIKKPKLGKVAKPKTEKPKLDKKVIAAKAKPAPKLKKPTPQVVPAPPQSKPDDLSKDGLYKIQVMRHPGEGYGIQVASYNSYDNVLRHVGELQAKWFKNILVHSVNSDNGAGTYKIVLGPLPDRPTAESYLNGIKKDKQMDGFIVNLANMK